jgi:nucleotide-binding universal stress UspA family protein
VAQATVLAKAHYGVLHLVRVLLRRNGPRSPSADQEEDVHPAVAVELRSTLAGVLRRGEHVRHRIKTLRGSPEEAIAAYARRHRARLIVISAADGSRRGSVGTPVARMLGRSASCPVLVVPAGTRRADAPVRAWFREVVCAFDLTKASAGALEAARTLIPSDGARITLVHALDRDQAATASRRLLRMVPVQALRSSRIDRVVVSEAAHRLILQVASAQCADLIVMGLPRRGRLSEVLSGSTSRAVLRGANCPVLLVPLPRDAST